MSRVTEHAGYQPAAHDTQESAPLCAWCQRPFDVMGTRYVAPHDEWYCSAGCRDLDTEVVV